MAVLGLIIVFTGIIFFEVPRLLREKMWGELMAFSGLMAVGAVLTAAYLLKINIPTPTDVVELIFSPFSDVLITLLQ